MAKKQLLKLLAVMLVLVLCVASFAACSQSSDDQKGSLNLQKIQKMMAKNLQKSRKIR